MATCLSFGTSPSWSLLIDVIAGPILQATSPQPAVGFCISDALQFSIPEAGDELLALDEALTDFAQKHPDKAALVNLRYFAGLTVAEAAQTLGISTSTADRQWTHARAWLYRRIVGDAEL